jgi:methylamine dehydrogenase accessory protein MauD
MELLIISNIILWVVIVALAIVIYALTRQVGVLYERVAPAGALAINQKLEVGQLAPEMMLPSLLSGLIEIGGIKQNSKSQLLFFISPECPVCKTLLPAIKSSANAEADWVDVVFASDGKNDDHQGYITKQGLDNYPYIVSELLGKNFGIAKLPYAVLIDSQGKIAAMGIINSREHIDSLFEAKEHQVASIQEYMANQNQAYQAK